MNKLTGLSASALLLISGTALAGDCNVETPPLVDVIMEYSDTTGTPFVIDPRVAAKVHIVGRDQMKIDKKTLIAILRLHGFAAYTADGVVYVVPDLPGQVDGDKLGVSWES